MQPSVKRTLHAHERVRPDWPGRRYVAGIALIVLGILALVATLASSAVAGEILVSASAFPSSPGAQSLADLG